MKTNLQLPARMELIAKLVKGNTAADIGTDHGFVPIHLYLSGKCSRVILADINEGPLEKAKENLALYQVPQEAAELRLGSGLEVLKPYEADSVIIAGMGGELICDILGKEPFKTETIPQFVLQPRTRESVLRRWLLDNGFYITDERLVEERGRICQIIVCEPAVRASETTAILAERIHDDFEMEYPPFWFLREEERPILQKFAVRELARLAGRLDDLERSQDPQAVQKQKELIQSYKARLEGIFAEIFPKGLE